MGALVPVLALILTAHEASLPCAFAPFPKTGGAAASPSADDAAAAVGAVLGPEALLATAPAAQHALGAVVDVCFGGVVASVARVDAAAARESEPAVRVSVVAAGAVERQWGACGDAEILAPGFAERELAGRRR